MGRHELKPSQPIDILKSHPFIGPHFPQPFDFNFLLYLKRDEKLVEARGMQLLECCSTYGIKSRSKSSTMRPHKPFGVRSHVHIGKINYAVATA